MRRLERLGERPSEDVTGALPSNGWNAVDHRPDCRIWNNIVIDSAST